MAIVQKGIFFCVVLFLSMCCFSSLRIAEFEQFKLEMSVNDAKVIFVVWANLILYINMDSGSLTLPYGHCAIILCYIFKTLKLSPCFTIMACLIVSTPDINI